MKNLIAMSVLSISLAACSDREASVSTVTASDTAPAAQATLQTDQATDAGVSSEPAAIATDGVQIPGGGLALWLRADTATAAPDGSLAGWESPNEIAARQETTE